MSRSPLLLLLLCAIGAAAAAVPGYREAPHFTNSAAAQCPPPLPPSDADAACSPRAAVHVAMTLDASYLRGTMAAVLSVLRHAPDAAGPVAPAWKDWIVETLKALGTDAPALPGRPDAAQGPSLARLSAQVDLLTGTLRPGSNRAAALAPG